MLLEKKIIEKKARKGKKWLTSLSYILLLKYRYNWKNLSKKQTNIFKGMAILLIVFHNFFRWVFPITGENEFAFAGIHLKNFFYLISKYPLESTNIIFSYFGHYGVQVFVFLSGYGLAKSFERNKTGFLAFLFKRFLKIYPPFFLAVLICIVFNIYKTANLPSIYHIKTLLWKLSLLTNFFPNQALSINGPWWFFSLIFQLYILFFPLMWLKRIIGNKLLILISILSLSLVVYLDPFFIKQGIMLRTLFIASIPEFCLGIYFAQKKEVRIPYLFIFLSLLVFGLGNMHPLFWYFSFFSIVMPLIILFQFSAKILERISGLEKLFIQFGKISLYLFAIHGILRNPLISIANEWKTFWITIVLSMVYFLFSTLFAIPIKEISKKI